MFVIPCKYKESSPIIECLDALKKNSPDSKILIVDSYSDDTTIFNYLSSHYDVKIAPIKNSNWEAGAFWIAHELYPDEDLFLLQDSVVITTDLEFVKNKDFFCLAYHDFQWFHHCSVVDKFNQNNNYIYDSSNKLVYGNNFFVKNYLIKILKKKGVDKILPVDKPGQCAMERFWGMIFSQEGFNIPENSFLHLDDMASLNKYHSFDDKIPETCKTLDDSGKKYICKCNCGNIYRNKYFTKYSLART